MINSMRGLPEKVFKFIEASTFSEFATVSAAGVPIDTPIYCFPSDDMSSIDLATGLAYPAKADRARRNPKVGLLLEGAAEEPVVSIRGRAAVRDSNLQANAVRYVSEVDFEGVACGLGWSDAREAVWYFSRIIVQVVPERIMWWDNAAAMNGTPHVWRAPADTVYPSSDPAAPGKVSPPPQWVQRPWQEIAEEAMSSKVVPHLTLCDEDGYPLPIRTSDYALVDGRFRLVIPRGAPWSRSGQATLSFMGLQTFVGNAAPESAESDVIWLAVERALPQLPLLQDIKEVMKPSPEVKAKLMDRLKEECGRRGQPIPVLPPEQPAPTRIAQLRYARRAGAA